MDDFFAGVSVDLTDSQKDKILQKVHALLEEKLGEKLADLVTDEQYAEFEALIDQYDETRLDNWLDQNLPDNQQIFDTVFEQIRQEVLADPQKFLAD